MQIVIVCQVSQFAKMKYGGDIGAEHAQDEDGVKLPVLDPGENVFAVTNFNSKIVGTWPHAYQVWWWILNCDIIYT